MPGGRRSAHRRHLVADGYGNARIHRFTADGILELSFGTAGAGDGQFNLPHSLAVDGRGRLVVVDRENYRLQLFGRDGSLLAISGVGDLRQPMDVHVDAEGVIYVAECYQRITIYDPDGAVISRWGEQGDPPGRFPSFLHGSAPIRTATCTWPTSSACRSSSAWDDAREA